MSGFGDGVYDTQGRPVGGLFATGQTFFVRPSTGSDTKNRGHSPRRAFKTLAQALSQATANHGDVVYLIAESNTGSGTTDYQSAVLNWNKDGVHLVGVNGGSFLGQRARISNLSTAASFANLFTLSANNCFISGIEFFQGAGSNTLSAAQTCVSVTGQRNHFKNCQISGMGDTTLDYAGSNSLSIGAGSAKDASENYFEDCYIGLDTVIRATSVTEVVINYTPSAGEKGSGRNIFNRCHFETYTSGSTFKMVTVDADTDRFVKFKDCEFHAQQNITSAVAPTGAIGITTMNGEVLLVNPFLYGFANYVTATNAYVQVLAPSGSTTSDVVGVAKSVTV
jgi:hypothetical protein